MADRGPRGKTGNHACQDWAIHTGHGMRDAAGRGRLVRHDAGLPVVHGRHALTIRRAGDTLQGPGTDRPAPLDGMMTEIHARPDAIWRDRSTPPHIVTLVLLTGISAMSMNIFLPSLPGMAAYFQADYALVQLSVSGYLAVTAGMQLIMGPLSDRYGRRPVIIGSISVFLAATVACIFAPDIETFLMFRMCQAAIATGFVLSRAIVRDMVEPDAAASMLGFVTMGMALVPMVSPMIGGLLDQAFDWRANFVAMFLAGLVLLWIVRTDLGETNRNRSVSLTAQFRAYPELVRSRRFWGYALTAAFTSGAFFTVLGGAPYVASEVLNLDPALLGFYFGFIALGYMSGNYLSGRLTQRVGLDRMMMFGTMFSLGALVIGWAFLLAGILHPLTLFGPVLLVGVGNGLTLPSANAGTVSVRPHLAGSASGLGGTLMVGGGAALSAVTGFLLGRVGEVWPLLFMMTLSAGMALAMSLWVRQVARRRGPVAPPAG